MTDMPFNDAPSDKVLAGTATTDGYQTEYQVIQGQRREFIRQYNVWFSIGQIMAHGTFWLMVNISLSIGSAPVMAGSAIAGTVIVFFSYRMVLEMDRSVVALYPRIIFLELQLGFDFYRDYLRRRPRGDTERSFIDKCEQMQVVLDGKLWNQINSVFNTKDFPANRRLTRSFKLAAWMSTALFWIIIGLIMIPQYFQAAS